MDLLKGIKVIDFTAAIAGTLNTMILADVFTENFVSGTIDSHARRQKEFFEPKSRDK